MPFHQTKRHNFLVVCMYQNKIAVGQISDGSSLPVDAIGAARAMLERAFPQAEQQAQVEQTGVQGQAADGQGVAQNTAAPVVDGQPVYSDIALADYMAKQAAQQKFGDVQQTPVGLQETMHAQDMSAQLDAIPEENVVASAQNNGTIDTDQLSYEERSALVDSILQTDSAQLWGQQPDGTNQGIKHFINYKSKYPQRILSLEQRLGVQTGDFSNTVQGFKLFTQRALEVIKHGKVREINGKKFYYLDGVANSKKGVIVIVKDGKIQSVMPSDFKSFNRLK